MKFETKYNFKDKVYMDSDKSIIGVVTGFCFKVEENCTIEISWIHSGEAKTAWFQKWRLTKC